MTCGSTMKVLLARITPPCTDVTRFVSESMEQTLPVLTRIKLRLHLMICEGCAQYRQQLLALRQALQRSASPSQDQRQDEPSLKPVSKRRFAPGATSATAPSAAKRSLTVPLHRPMLDCKTRPSIFSWPCLIAIDAPGICRQRTAPQTAWQGPFPQVRFGSGSCKR
jgi:hypothetical protein